ncbi:acyl-CoA synthetase (AMP-forming)/AMP-acid ligase II [Streptomyces aurantiacus]|uniref:AMP-binding protein n=1 Tax=Streptomyces aurantiacus TaxID=47760 RepID=UPI00278D562F|nr:AMP-binding protein [Streptomyces aurantiacus]MDQ0773212.1 acyl-CoA synthetase (AMP-forming)/AMP-acid ligase II [Streptomyces aurantiacus]
MSGHPRTGGRVRPAAAAPAGLAVLRGGPLLPPPVGTLGEALLRAKRTAHGVVLIDGEGIATRRSYAQLYDDALRTLGGLAAAGPPPGARVILRTANAADLLTAFWACVLGGLVPLPVSYGTDATGLGEAARAVGEAWLVSDEAPAPLPSRLTWLGPVDSLRDTRPGPVRPVDALPDDLAVLTLTSGSAGRPKAVPLTHRHVLSRAQATAVVRRLDEDTRSLNWMPLDHVSGIVMFHVRDVFLGCHQVHADTGWVRADPLRWLDVADVERIDTTWAPNHAFALVADRVERHPARSWDLSRLRYIMNGGEAVKERTARRFVAALAPHGLPPTAVHPGWGMPETASGVVDGVFRPGDGPLRRHVPVGVPHPGVSVRVVDEEGQVLPAGAVGRLQVTGAPVVGAYFEGGAPRPAPLSADGWLVTDDLAFVADGELTVTGRADGLIEVNGASYQGHEIEDAVEELPCVLPSFTVARSFPADGAAAGGLSVFFRPRAEVPPREAEELVRGQVRSRFGADAAHVEALAEHELPRTATGKLRRSVLAARLPGARR